MPTAAIYPIGAIISQDYPEEIIWIRYLSHYIHQKQIRGYLHRKDFDQGAYFIVTESIVAERAGLGSKAAAINSGADLPLATQRS